MDYNGHVILDFARRTRSNLEFIERNADTDSGPYEVTQLVNSMLGLLVFPQQEFMNDLPETPLADLKEDGWPSIDPVEGALRKDNLKELMRTLRNSIAHSNLKFCANPSTYEVESVCLWNIRKGNVTWKAILTIADLRIIALKLIGVIENCASP